MPSTVSKKLTPLRDKCDRSVQEYEARVMTAFLLSKLDDLDTVQPALRGLGVLTDMKTFSDESAIETVESCA